MLCTAHRELDGDDYADEVGLYKEPIGTIHARYGLGNVVLITFGYTDIS